MHLGRYTNVEPTSITFTASPTLTTWQTPVPQQINFRNEAHVYMPALFEIASLSHRNKHMPTYY